MPENHYPLTRPQEFIWNDQIVYRELPWYNIGGYYILRGPLKVDALVKALELTIDNNQSFNLVFGKENGIPFQRIEEKNLYQIFKDDFSAEENALDLALAKIKTLMNETFTLINVPLYQFRIIKTDNECHILFVKFHHLISDGWSVHIVRQAVVNYYNSIIKGESVVNRSSSYLSVLAIDGLLKPDSQAIKSTSEETSREQWINSIFENLTINPLYHQYAISRKTIWLNHCHINNLRAFKQRYNVDLLPILTSLVYIYMRRIFRKKDILFMMPLFNRPSFVSKNTTGMFMISVPVLVNEANDIKYNELCHCIKITLLQVYRKFAAGMISAGANFGTAALNDLYLSYQPYRIEKEFDALSCESHTLASSYGKMMLAFEFNDNGPGHDICLNIDYRTSRFDDLFINNFCEYLANAIEFLPQLTDEFLSLFPLLDQNKFQKIIVDTNRHYMPEICCDHIPGRFKRCVKEFNRQTAIKYNDRLISYGELDAIVARLSSNLVLTDSLKKGDRVMVIMDKGWEIVPVILSIMNSGCVYIPVDPAYPQERISFILDDCKPDLILIHDSLKHHAPSLSPYKVMTFNESFASEIHEINIDILPDDLAYIMYTSGSTGKPKGVIASHANLASFFSAMDNVLPSVSNSDKWLNLSGITFDISLLELLWPLCNGMQVILLDRKVLSMIHDPVAVSAPTDFSLSYFSSTNNQGLHHLDELKEKTGKASLSLAETMIKNQITHIQSTPSLAVILMENEAFNTALKGIERWLIGGEVLPGSLAARIMQAAPVKILNMYGPTETTVWSTCSLIEKNKKVTIGRPLSNTMVYVLDEDLQPLPPGTPGELYIAGSGVTKGYLNRPELTMENFITDPFHENSVMYKTGDLAEWSEEGDLIYRGRRDNQVKLRGYRIELEEVDHCAKSFPLINDAISIVTDPGNGKGQELVLFIKCNSPMDHNILSAHMRNYLPVNMCPSVIMELDEFPMTPNGKTDRKKLQDQYESEAITMIKPQHFSRKEEALLQVWKDLLKNPTISIYDNFFQLGGDSINAIQMVSILSEMGIKMEVRDLFTYPTIRALLPYIKSEASPADQIKKYMNKAVHAGAESEASLNLTQRKPAYADFLNHPIPRVPEANEYPLSMHQAFIFEAEKHAGARNYYNEPRAFYIRGSLDVSALGKCFELIVNRHESLRTYFSIKNGQIFQKINDKADVSFTTLDLTQYAGIAVEAQNHAINEFLEPFDLFKGPLIRMKLLILEPDHYMLLLTTHHIISDGWSMGVLIREFISIYNDLIANQSIRLPALQFQYRDFSQWINNLVQDDILIKQKAYWNKQLNGQIKRLHLPADFEKTGATGYSGHDLVFRLNETEKQQMDELSRKHNTTLFMNFLGLVNYVLYDLTGQTDITVGTHVTGRIHPSLENQIGLFTNYVVLRTILCMPMNTGNYLKDIKETVLDAFDNQIYPYPNLIGKADYEYHPLYNPLFDVLVLEKINEGKITGITGAKIDWYKPPYIISRFDLCFYINKIDDEYEITIRFKTELFRKSTIEKMKLLLRYALALFFNSQSTDMNYH